MGFVKGRASSTLQQRGHGGVPGPATAYGHLDERELAGGRAPLGHEPEGEGSCRAVRDPGREDEVVSPEGDGGYAARAWSRASPESPKASNVDAFPERPLKDAERRPERHCKTRVIP